MQTVHDAEYSINFNILGFNYCSWKKGGMSGLMMMERQMIVRNIDAIIIGSIMNNRQQAFVCTRLIRPTYASINISHFPKLLINFYELKAIK